MRRALAIAIAALAASAACGDDASYIVLEVSASCQDGACAVPAEVDVIRVTVRPAGEAEQEIAPPTDVTLKSGEAFPIELLVEPSDTTPETLREEVEAWLAGDLVGRVVVEHSWTRGEVTRVPVALEVP